MILSFKKQFLKERHEKEWLSIDFLSLESRICRILSLPLSAKQEQDEVCDMEELELIKEKIYIIREQRVMFDFDLAKLYGVETKVLKQTVRKNIKRFEGEDFMFELTQEDVLKLQIGDRRKVKSRHPAFVFTELGVAMLGCVLTSDIAIEINRRIMRSFIAVRQYITSQTSHTGRLEHRIREIDNTIKNILHNKIGVNEDTRMQLKRIEETLAELQANKKPPVRRVVVRQ